MDKQRKDELTGMLRAVIAMFCKTNDLHPLHAIELVAAEAADMAADLRARPCPQGSGA